MKKKNLKSLELNKKSISLLKDGSINGGDPTSHFSCPGGVCTFEPTELVCSSWWGGQLCKPCDKK